MTDVNINDDSKVKKLQDYLREEGFRQFFETNHPLYSNPSIRGAYDCLMTYTSFDWMLTDRHLGKWDYETMSDLKNKIDQDEYLAKSEGNILIFHDQDETYETFKSLIDYMVIKGYKFLPAG